MMKRMMPVGAIVLALGLAAVSADAGQRDNRGRDRNGRESRGEAQRDNGRRDEPRAQGRAEAPHDQGRVEAPREQGRVEAPRQQGRVDAPRQQGRVDGPRPEANRSAPNQAVPRGDVRPDGGQDRGGRYDAPPPRDYRNDNRGNERRDAYRHDRRDTYRYDGYRYDNYRYDNYRYDNYRYYRAPRNFGPGRPRYYGPGGGFSVYFGLGNGYLYGSPYSGRVYGYVAPRAYGVRIYYGDLRLQVRPRNAAVYVDGYYAGVVDDFDGVFQRLTLEVGPHQIELEAPGLEPQVFDVYIDPARTVNIRADLYPY